MHYSNDYFDLEADKYGKPSRFAGESGILVKNPELKKFSKWFSIALLSLSLIIAALFMVLFSYPIWFFLMVLANLLAWFYSAPPLRLSYNKLGELATISVCFVMPAIGYLPLMGTIDLPFIIFSYLYCFTRCCLSVQFKFQIGKEINLEVKLPGLYLKDVSLVLK